MTHAGQQVTRRRGRALAVALGTVILIATCVTQAASVAGPTVTGTVVDSIGAAIPNATVSAFSSRTDSSPDVSTTTGPDGRFTLDVAAGPWFLRYAAPRHLTRWHDGRTSQATADVLNVGAGGVSGLRAMLPEVLPTGGMDFFPQKTPIKISAHQVWANGVTVYDLPNSNGCACVTFADGTRAQEIGSMGLRTGTIFGIPSYTEKTGPVQMIVFDGLTVHDDASIVSDAGAGHYEVSVTEPADPENATLGGRNTAGEPMRTVVYGRLWHLSLSPLCGANWSWAAGIAQDLTAGGFCVTFTAYAVATHDPSPAPSAYNNPIHLPQATFRVTSK